MKNLFIIKVLFILTSISSLFIASVSASSDFGIQDSSAQSLVKLNIMEGYEDGSLRLEDKIKRSELITLIVRILGYDGETEPDTVNLTFKDIDSNHWAYNYIKLAVKHRIVDGYSDNTVAPDNYVTYAETLSLLVKALGYQSSLEGNWPDNVIDKSDHLGINKNMDLPHNKQLTRGEVSVLVKNSLTVDFSR